MSDDALPKGLVPFNGYKKLHSVMTPISLGPVKCVQWLDKHVYGVLRYMAGNSDRCRVMISGAGQDSRGNHSMAGQLELSKTSVSRSFDRLAAAGLIHCKRCRNEVLVIFLQSTLLLDSFPKDKRPDPPWEAANPEVSPAPLLKKSRSVRNEASGKFEKRQNLHQEAADLPPSKAAEMTPPYKEALGDLGKKDKPTPPAQTPPASVEVSLVQDGRFAAWWVLWTSVMGSNHKSRAEQAYGKYVTSDLEQACFDCTRSYVASRGDRNSGYNPENFLKDQAVDGFTAEWPPWKRPFDKNQQRRGDVNKFIKALRR